MSQNGYWNISTLTYKAETEKFVCLILLELFRIRNTGTALKREYLSQRRVAAKLTGEKTSKRSFSCKYTYSEALIETIFALQKVIDKVSAVKNAFISEWLTFLLK